MGINHSIMREIGFVKYDFVGTHRRATVWQKAATAFAVAAAFFEAKNSALFRFALLFWKLHIVHVIFGVYQVSIGIVDTGDDGSFDMGFFVHFIQRSSEEIEDHNG